MEPPGMYSMKMDTTRWWNEVPKKPTMLACRRVFRSSTSPCRWAYSPSAAAGSEASRLTCFTATSWPWLVRPQYTWWDANQNQSLMDLGSSRDPRGLTIP